MQNPSTLAEEAARIRRTWPSTRAAQQQAWRQLVRHLAAALEAVHNLDRSPTWDYLPEPAKASLPTLAVLLDTAQRHARRSARLSRENERQLSETFATDLRQFRAGKRGAA